MNFLQLLLNGFGWLSAFFLGGMPPESTLPPQSIISSAPTISLSLPSTPAPVVAEGVASSLFGTLTSKPVGTPIVQPGQFQTLSPSTHYPPDSPATSGPVGTPTGFPTMSPIASPSQSPIENAMAKEPALSDPDPDTIADHSKKIKVFVMSGQSNMLGYGVVSNPDTNGTLAHITEVEGKYQHLVNDNGIWTTRADVRSVYKSSQATSQKWLSVGGAIGPKFFGPELQIGHILGEMLDQPVLLLKVGVGNRALGWDFLPPGSSQAEYNNQRFAGHGQCPPTFGASASPGQSNQCGCKIGSDCNDIFWSSKDQCTNQGCWCKANGACPSAYYAGYQYDQDLGDAREVLDNIGDYFPGYNNQGFEIGGFFFWQGYRDTTTAGHAHNYFSNLVQYINSLRNDYSLYSGGGEAPFVLGSLGFKGCDFSKWNSNSIKVWQAQMDVTSEANIAGLAKVKTIDARSMWRTAQDSPQNEFFHYNKNANTFLEMGNKMGWAMVDMLKGTKYMEPLQCHLYE